MVTAVAAPLLHAADVAAALGGHAVLHGVDVEVDAGEVVGLIGPNGAGKSTLLRAVTGLIPASGTIELRGKAVSGLSRREVARTLAVVQQLPEAPIAMRVDELALLGRNPHLGLLGRESERDYAIARAAMQRAGCEHLAERTLGTLSGGERRRAFIARALAQEPRLLLLDEPTANLDVQAQCEIFELLRALAADGVGVLVVVHDLTIAAAYCDRVALLSQGRLVASGVPGAVLTERTLRDVYGARVSVIRYREQGPPIVIPSIVEGRP
jgi:iron complex transport system ATP-binding protein